MGLGLGDDGQVDKAQIHKRRLGPVVGLPGIRVNGVGDELLAMAKDLQRMALDALEWGIGTIDQEPFRGMADPYRRAFAKQLVSERFKLCGQCLIGHVDVDPGHHAAGHANAGLWPLFPDRQFMLGGGAGGMLHPPFVGKPFFLLKRARKFLPRHDGQYGKAPGNQTVAVLHHELLAHGIILPIRRPPFFRPSNGGTPAAPQWGSC